MDDWIESLENTLRSLETMPERCPLAPENGRWFEDLELRQLLFTEFPSTYRIIFTVIEGKVRILQVRHGARRFLYEEDDDH